MKYLLIVILTLSVKVYAQTDAFCTQNLIKILSNTDYLISIANQENSFNLKNSILTRIEFGRTTAQCTLKNFFTNRVEPNIIIRVFNNYGFELTSLNIKYSLFGGASSIDAGRTSSENIKYSIINFKSIFKHSLINFPADFHLLKYIVIEDKSIQTSIDTNYSDTINPQTNIFQAVDIIKNYEKIQNKPPLAIVNDTGEANFKIGIAKRIELGSKPYLITYKNSTKTKIKPNIVLYFYNLYGVNIATKKISWLIDYIEPGNGKIDEFSIDYIDFGPLFEFTCIDLPSNFMNVKYIIIHDKSSSVTYEKFW